MVSSNLMKYFLLNSKIPCVCTCHKACLERDLRSQGYEIKSLVQITKERYNRIIKDYISRGISIDFNVTEFE